MSNGHPPPSRLKRALAKAKKRRIEKIKKAISRKRRLAKLRARRARKAKHSKKISLRRRRR